MKILEVYKKYKIMSQLQEHQLRVAAVAKQICDNLEQPINRKMVVKACLVHDLANIIKADLTMFPKYIPAAELSRWQTIKQDFITRYGSDEQAANLAIAREIGAPDEVIELIKGIGFTNLPTIATSNSLELRIVEYADLRVSPDGVVSIDERLKEGRERYKRQGKKEMLDDQEFNKHADTLRQIEQQISAKAKIKPGDITDQSVAPIIAQLKLTRFSLRY